jgi:hypothetical protein
MAEGTENVGIRAEQKAEIKRVLEENPGSYSSINEFVQKAIDRQLMEGLKVTDKSSNEEKVIGIVTDSLNNLIKSELNGEISLNSNVINGIKMVLSAANELKKMKISYNTETEKLIYLRTFKSKIDFVIQQIDVLRLGGSVNPLKPMSLTERNELFKHIQQLRDAEKNAMKLLYSDSKGEQQ